MIVMLMIIDALHQDWGGGGEKAETSIGGETPRPHFHKVQFFTNTNTSENKVTNTNTILLWIHFWLIIIQLSQATKELRSCWTEALVPQLEVFCIFWGFCIFFCWKWLFLKIIICNIFCRCAYAKMRRKRYELRKSASSFHWLSSSIFTVCRL